jgi:HTH-type transcriptional regulator/antitoxin HipB
MDYAALTPKQLGQILKRCRSQRGMTQLAAGSTVGLKQSTISAIEADAGRSRVASLYKLLSSLGLELVLRDKTAGPATRTSKREW